MIPTSKSHKSPSQTEEDESRWVEDEMKWDEHTEITNSCPSAVGSESFWKRGSNRCGTAWLCSQSCSLPVASPNRLIIIFPSRSTPVQAASREWRSTEGRARTSGTARRNQDWNDSELGHSWAHKLDYCVYLLFESGSNGFSTANPCQGCYCPRFQRATAAELFIRSFHLHLDLDVFSGSCRNVTPELCIGALNIIFYIIITIIIIIIITIIIIIIVIITIYLYNNMCVVLPGCGYTLWYL